MMGVIKCMRLFRHKGGGNVVGKPLRRSHVKCLHCSTERLQSTWRAAGALARAPPQVVQACQVRRAWRRPYDKNALSASMVEPFDADVQIGLGFFPSLIATRLGQISIGHSIDCFTGWSAVVFPRGKKEEQLLHCGCQIWIIAFGAVTAFTLDEETGMREIDASPWPAQTQPTLKRKAPHQTALLVERHGILRRCEHIIETQMLRDSFVCRFHVVQGAGVFLHSVFISINDRAPCQALLCSEPHVLPPFAGGCYRYLDVQWHNRMARVREIAAVDVIGVSAPARLARVSTQNGRCAGVQ